MVHDPDRTTSSSNGSLSHALSDADVAAYLREHPDFLLQHGDLIPVLTPPAFDHGEGVRDLQFYMLQRLRDSVTASQGQQRALIATTRANLHNQNRVHGAVLCLLDARNFEQLIQIVTTDLAVLLDLDVVSLVMEAPGGLNLPQAKRTGVHVVPMGTVDAWMGVREIAVNAGIEGSVSLHGDAAGLVQSEILVRLKIGSNIPTGLLCFGSRDPDMFHPAQGTELVGFLTRVVERCIRAWLDLPA